METYNDEIIAISRVSGDFGNVEEWRKVVVEAFQSIEKKAIKDYLRNLI